MYLKKNCSYWEGLNNLISLRKLFLGGNQIKEIKSLDNLKNLRVLRLDISFEISEIKGLDRLKKLEELHLEVIPWQK